VNTSESKSFTGLPIPAAAGAISSYIIFYQWFFGPDVRNPIYIVILAYALAFLMVSTIRYRSLKQLNLREKKSFHVLVMLLLILLIVAALPSVMCFILFLGYVISGPTEMILKHMRVLTPHAIKKRRRSRILKGEKGERR
jgi:CDP-diacylglycerol--serine O-phosphatidyltransferase